MTNDPKTDLCKDFTREWRKTISFSAFTHKTKQSVQELFKSQRFEKISSRKIEEITYISKSTINDIRSGRLADRRPLPENPQSTHRHHIVHKKGRPTKLTAEDRENIIQQASARRKKGLAVSIKWVTDLANDLLKERRQKVTRFTIKRLFASRGWRRRKCG